MYLVVEGQSCPVAVDGLSHAEICIGQEYEYVEDELVVQAFEAARPCGRNGNRRRGCGQV
jgi:hypothetical protein